MSSLFYLTLCVGLYKLGAFNERHPGKAWRYTLIAGKRLQHWLKQ